MLGLRQGLPRAQVCREERRVFPCRGASIAGCVGAATAGMLMPATLSTAVHSPQCAAKAGGDVCRWCRKAVVAGKFVEYNGKKVHANCFNCDQCNKSLVGTPFGEHSGGVFCQQCLIAKTKVSGSVHTGAYTPGFTVNPMTGAKEQRGPGGAMIGAKTPGLGTKDRCPKCEQPVYMGPDRVRFHGHV